jgi:hypothetical protein
VEISVLVLGVLFERLRPDLRVRRWWARHGWSPAIGSGVAVPVPVALAGVDTRRMLLRPSTLFVGYVLWRVFAPALPPLSAYDGVNRTVGFPLAFLGLFVLVLVATLAGRDRGEEIVAATPRGESAPAQSWLALLLAVAVLEYGVLALLRFGRDEPTYGELLPGAWQLAQGPLLLVGGGVLGLLAARLLPGWVAAPVAAVLAVLWVGTLSATFTGLTMLAPVVEWIQYHEDGRVTVEPGSFGWHNAYLLGLCGLGMVAVLLLASRQRVRLLAVGAALAVGTVTAGALALP